MTDGDGRETELEQFKRKYHEAMEVLSRWGNIDAAEATARLIQAEKAHEKAFESVVRINERLCRELDEYKRRLDALAQDMAGFTVADGDAWQRLAEELYAELEFVEMDHTATPGKTMLREWRERIAALKSQQR